MNIKRTKIKNIIISTMEDFFWLVMFISCAYASYNMANFNRIGFVIIGLYAIPFALMGIKNFKERDYLGFIISVIATIYSLVILFVGITIF